MGGLFVAALLVIGTGQVIPVALILAGLTIAMSTTTALLKSNNKWRQLREDFPELDAVAGKMAPSDAEHAAVFADLAKHLFIPGVDPRKPETGEIRMERVKALFPQLEDAAELFQYAKNEVGESETPALQVVPLARALNTTSGQLKSWTGSDADKIPLPIAYAVVKTWLAAMLYPVNPS